MNNTRTERIQARLVGVGKRHQKWRYFCLALICVVLAVSYFFKFLSSKGKRLMAVAVVCMFFLTCSSFAFVEQSENRKVDVSEYVEEPIVVLEPSKSLRIYEADSPVLGESEITSLGDMDAVTDVVADEYEFSEDLALEEEVQQYSIEEIIDSMDPESVTVAEEAKESQKMDRDAWNLILINKQHSVPEGYEVKMCNVVSDKMCDERILPELLQMMKDAKEDGITLVICSAYRSYEYQVGLFEKKIRNYMNHGYSYMDAYQLSAQAVTVPGFSEHQLGLSFDIVAPTYTSLNFGFGKTETGRWLKNNSYKYGFILRYPEGKEYVTGIEYEPWHYRYVGVDAATIIMQEEITLEEFVDNIEDYQ